MISQSWYRFKHLAIDPARRSPSSAFWQENPVAGPITLTRRQKIDKR
jgi:hypothetical protein